MPNPWIEHVKKYAKDNNISYGCAITEAKGSYVKKSSAKKSSVEVKPIEKKKDTIQEDESELKGFKNAYYESTFKTTGGRLQPARARGAAGLAAQYNKLKAKLEKLTGKKYEELESSQTQQKRSENLRRKSEKEDRERERLKKLQPPVLDDPNQFILGMGRKKIKGVL